MADDGRLYRFFQVFFPMLAVCFCVVSLFWRYPVCCGAESVFRVAGSKEELARHVQIELMTVGRGAGIEARYGHTLLRIYNAKTGHSLVINWGIFSFSEPDFILNFFLGRLRYWVAGESYARVLHRYRNWERRSVVSDRLNLTFLQKKKLLELLSENLKPENRYFWYQYFYRNCATYPRDLLDQVLGGIVKSRFSDAISDRSFRYYVRENLNRPPIIAFLLDILMNSRLDEKISQWTEMFYPPKLREYLYEIPAVSDDGIPIEGAKLLSDPRILVNLPDVPRESWLFHWLFFLVMTPLGGMALFFGFKSRGKRSQICLMVLFVLGGLLWSCFSGSLGLCMAASWLFSEHADLHHNANLWLFWPFDFIYSLSPLILRKNGGAFIRRLSSCLRILSLGHMGAIFCWLMLFASGLIRQDVSLIAIWIVPFALLFYGSIVRGVSRVTIGGLEKWRLGKKGSF